MAAIFNFLRLLARTTLDLLHHQEHGGAARKDYSQSLRTQKTEREKVKITSLRSFTMLSMFSLSPPFPFFKPVGG